tara:strand:+ start:165 stop:785 length:621 start_codon:yes stop_codon:yes gene_type:complete
MIYIKSVHNPLREFRNKQILVYIFKPLTMIFIILLAVTESNALNVSYRITIIAALVFSLMGDIFLMLPKNRFIHGLLSFLIAHLFFIYAFSSNLGTPFHFWSFIPVILFFLTMVRILWSHLGKMKILVIIYALIISTMLLSSIELWLQQKEAWSSFVIAGGLLFCCSDSLLGYNRFAKPLKNAQFFILTTYYAAQWCFAMSVRHFA